MAIFIDPPRWPAHGTLWSHLITDSSTEELHDFAKNLGVPRRGFDLDHYDVPASRLNRAQALGAELIESKELAKRLAASSLRVKSVDRDRVRKQQRTQYLRHEWAVLGTLIMPSDISEDSERWQGLGQDLLHRWNEPHRRYHDETHLEDVLLSLNQLEIRGEIISPATLLATWFHDAIYDGVTGEDERRSAELAVSCLTAFPIHESFVTEARDLILATTPGNIASNLLSDDRRNDLDPHLSDADLAIFAAGQKRYQRYMNAVREEYSHVPDRDFRLGRSNILQQYLNQKILYRSEQGFILWEEAARQNLFQEIRMLQTDEGQYF